MYVCMYVCIDVCLYVGVDYTYIDVNTLAQGIKSFLASHVWSQAVAGARTYGTDSPAITSQPRMYVYVCVCVCVSVWMCLCIHTHTHIYIRILVFQETGDSSDQELCERTKTITMQDERSESLMAEQHKTSTAAENRPDSFVHR